MRLPLNNLLRRPIEEQISGVDKMNYMYSLNANSGQMRLRVNFDESTDPKTDQVLTQMRQAQAAARLPAGSDRARRERSEVLCRSLDADRAPFNGWSLRFRIPD